MELTFIGTGSGKTNLNRYHTSLLIQSGNHNVLIDAGDGISRALLSSGINFETINSILISHYHADHFGGLSALITQMILINRTNTLQIFTHKDLVEPLITYLKFCYIFVDHLSGFQRDDRPRGSPPGSKTRRSPCGL